MSKRTALTLARMANVGDPDSPTSPGSLFLLSLQDDVLEAMANHDTDGEVRDAAFEGVEVRGFSTSQAWAIFVDLSLWRLDPPVEGNDMTKMAEAIVYEVGHNLVSVILDDEGVR